MAEIFEYFLRLTLGKDGISVAFQFPENIPDKAVLQSIPRFCFPEGMSMGANQETEKKIESFSFVSTLSDGNKRYGYCRRFLDPDIVELKFSEGDKSVYAFLHSVLAQPFPDPGETIQAQTFSTVVKEDGQVDYIPESFRLTRSNDDYEYLEYVSYENLFRSLDLDKIMLIFHCLLTERRILVAADTLSKLTSCIDAISNMAYPFSWQYVFIPILPSSMLSFLGAPMPFLIGILSSSLPEAQKEPMEEGVLIVDLDNNEIIQAPDDLPDLMPPTATEKLRKSMKKALASEKRNMEFSIEIAHALLKFFTTMFGNYSKYFELVNNKSGTIERFETNGNAKNDDDDSKPFNPAPISSSAPSLEYRFNFDRFIKSKSIEQKKFLLHFKDYQVYMYFIQERETWAKKGLLNSCILLRAQTKQTKDSIAAVKAKFRLKFGKMIAAWNEGHATSSHVKKPKEPNATGDSNDIAINSNSTSIDDVSEDIDETTESGSSNGGGKSPAKQRKLSREKSLNASKDKNMLDRPRAATSLDKPSPNFSFKTKVSPTKADDPAASSNSDKTSSNNSNNSKNNPTQSDLKSDSADNSNAPPPVAKKPAIVPVQYTFKPTPTGEGNLEKNIWKLCNSEAFSDTRLNSSDFQLYWTYSPLLFQRIPEMSSFPKENNVMSLDLSSVALEALLQWVHSDEVSIETPEAAIELLQLFETAKGSTLYFKHAVVADCVANINKENVFHYLKVFGSKQSEDTFISAILTASKLLVASFSSEDMNPAFRRQLSSLPSHTITSILNLRASAYAKQEAQSSVDKIVSQRTSSSISSSSTRSRLKTDLAKLLASGDNADVEITVSTSLPSSQTTQPSTKEAQEVSFKLHSKILATRSPYLAKFLASHPGPRVHLQTVTATPFEKLIHFMYTGQFESVREDRFSVFAIVQAAHVLEMDTPQLRDALFQELSHSFTSVSVFEFFDNKVSATVPQHPSQRAILVGAAAYYIAHHPTIFSRPEKLKDLEPDVWECILKYAFDQKEIDKSREEPPTTPRGTPIAAKENEPAKSNPKQPPAVPPKKKK